MNRISRGFLSVFIALAACIGIGQISCRSWSEISERTEKAVREVEILQKRTPIPERFVKERSEKTTRFGFVTFSDGYRTTDDCGSIGGYYSSHFLGEGWDPKLMRDEEVGGGLRTRSFTFANGEFSVVVECQIDVLPEDDKIVGIVFKWRSK